MNQLVDCLFRKMIILALAAVLFPACQGEVKLAVVAGVDACHRCSMVIDQVNQASGYIQNGELVTFDSPGCLLASYDQLRIQGDPLPEQIFFVDYQEGTWHPAPETAFLLTKHIPTVMNSGVVCFGSTEAAGAMKQYDSEKVTDWLGYRTARGLPDKEVDVSFGLSGMSPEVVEVAKGELILWRAVGIDLAEDLKITLKGYPEVGSINVPATGEEVSFRLLAVRPGDGFPVIETESGRPLGRMKVSGAHTLDEEEM